MWSIPPVTVRSRASTLLPRRRVSSTHAPDQLSTSVLSANSQAEHHSSGLREQSDNPTKTKWTSETSTVHLQRDSPRSVDGHVELLGHAQGPLDTFPWSSSTPQPLSADTFATTSTTDSASSILLSPVLSFEDVDTPTILQEFPTGPSRSQSDVSQESGMLAGYGITAEDRDSEVDIQAGGRKAETSTRTSRDTACPEEDSDPQQSDQRTSGDRACFEENSELVRSDQRASGEGAHLEEDSESEQSDSGSGDSGCADSYCSTIIPDELPHAATHVACFHTGGGTARSSTLQGEGLIPSDKQKREDDKDFPEEEDILHDEEVSDEEKVSGEGRS
ncbi:uncharacterized protein LOC118794577 [Megalops cyprinoides]|uniref:uncharacterized protein LOC118794577 n=1 Tax=Megalops cyprinoides TaxID=118141 RepID=UPI001864E7F5|nr:uncharacterized protein LOC118794577 [Megalops cyprinoides]